MKRLLFFIVLLTEAASAGSIINSYRFAAAGGGGAIAFANVSSERNTSNPSSETTAHTIGTTLTNGYVVVEIGLWDSADDTVTGVTFDGVSMTQIGVTNVDFFGEYRCYIYGLAVGSKAAGTYNAISTFNSPIEVVNTGVVSYNNVHQTASVGTAVGANGSSTSASVNVSSATNERVIAVTINHALSQAPGSGETERWDTDTGSNGDDIGAGYDEAGASTTTMSVTLGDSAQWLILGVPLKPAP